MATVKRAWAGAFGGMAILVLWIGAAIVCPDGTCHAPALDQHLLEALHTRQQPALDAFFTTITWLGSMWVLAPIALGLGWCLRARPLSQALFPLLALASAWLIAHAAKLAVARPRPAIFPALIEMPADASYPSAHAMQAWAVALACVLLVHARNRAAALAVAIVLTGIVAISRLYLQVHFPTDVIAGFAVASCWVLGLWLLTRTAR